VFRSISMRAGWSCALLALYCVCADASALTPSDERNLVGAASPAGRLGGPDHAAMRPSASGVALRRRWVDPAAPPAGPGAPVAADTVAFSLLAFAEDPNGVQGTGVASVARGAATLGAGPTLLTDQSGGRAPAINASVSQTQQGGGRSTVFGRIFTGGSSIQTSSGSFLPAGTSVGTFPFPINTYAIDFADVFHSVDDGLALNPDSIVEEVMFSFFDEGSVIFASSDVVFLNDLISESVAGSVPGTLSELRLQTGAGVPAGSDLTTFGIDGIEVAITVRSIPTPGAAALFGLAAMFSLTRSGRGRK